MIGKIHKKLNYLPLEMEKARLGLLRSQHELNQELDKRLVIPLAEEDRTGELPKSLEFEANQWMEIRQVIGDVIQDIKNIVGYAQSIVFPGTEADGTEMIVGYIKSGMEMETIAIPWNRRLHIIRGVLLLQFIDGPELEKKKKLFTGESFFIPAGQRLRYQVIHNTVFLTRFLINPNETE